MKRIPNTASALAHAGALIVPLLLAACGGGGGGDTDTSSTTAAPLSLTITTTNAKSASADAMDNALTTASSSSAAAVNLLKSQAVAGPGGVPSLVQTATALARLAPATGKAKAKTKADVGHLLRHHIGNSRQNPLDHLAQLRADHHPGRHATHQQAERTA